VVDDDVINRTLTVAMLEKLGLAADAASGGQEALAMVPNGSYSVVLMDLEMPDMDGVETTRAIRRLTLPRQPFIIALTANAFESDRERCLQAGMDDFLSKPFRFNALREKMDSHVRTLPGHRS
jgi:CheY-like chemotaxis protein